MFIKDNLRPVLACADETQQDVLAQNKYGVLLSLHAFSVVKP